MGNKYLITSEPVKNASIESMYLCQTDGYFIYAEGTKNNNFILPGLCIYLDGYIQPRNEFYSKYGQYKNTKLVKFLWTDFGVEFIKYIKGIFTIIIIHDDIIDIFTDQFGFSNVLFTKLHELKQYLIH